MIDYHQPLLPDQTYHLFSRAVGNEKLFIASDNYHFFLQRLKLHTLDVCSFYCYSLLPNHFHLLARVHDEDSLVAQFEKVKRVGFDQNVHSLSDFVMKRFSNCLNSYAKAFNKMYRRKGALFMDYLKRSKVENENDFTSFIWYIHKNAVYHRITQKIGEWQFDSYNSLLSSSQLRF